MDGRFSSVTRKCSQQAKSLEKTQIPVLGPFPDEPLMSSVDRVLFLFDKKRIQKYFNSDSSSKENIDSNYSTNDGTKYKMRDNCSSGGSFVQESATYTLLKKASCRQGRNSSGGSNGGLDSSHCRRRGTIRRNYKETSGRPENGPISAPLRVLKKSISLCSLACRRFKEKVFYSSESTAMPCASPNWLWTKVKTYTDGCQVYEVFKESSTAVHPTKFDTHKAPKIIFVILPRGVIMPFETLPRH